MTEYLRCLHKNTGEARLLTVELDEYPENPLEEEYFSAPIFAFKDHSRYNLGHPDGVRRVYQEIENYHGDDPRLFEYVDQHFFQLTETVEMGISAEQYRMIRDACPDWQGRLRYEEMDNPDWLGEQTVENLPRYCEAFGWLCLPVYIMDHSGISLSLRPSGSLLGYVCWSPLSRDEWFGRTNVYSHAEDEDAEDAEVMQGMVQRYAAYLAGDVYVISMYHTFPDEDIETFACEEEPIDGFTHYGLDWEDEARDYFHIWRIERVEV